MTTDTAKPSRVFDIWYSERSYRYKEEALHNHAPNNPGIYEIVAFDAEQKATVVYMALTLDKSIFVALDEHWRGERQPAVQSLFKQYPNLYFSYILESDAKTPEDLQDLFYALVQADKPLQTEPAAPQPTGRYAQLGVKDKSIL